MANMSDDELLKELLGDDHEEEPQASISSLDARIISGFEEIVAFWKRHDRLPRNIHDRDIFERLYAVRLGRIRGEPSLRAVLTGHSFEHLIDMQVDEDEEVELADDELLALLDDGDSSSDITVLRHVKSAAERREAEEIADRKQCPDFDAFKGLFKLVKDELESGVRTAMPYRENADISQGQFFILSGVVVYVAEVTDETRVAPNGIPDARLRLIYDNGTESNLWQTSLRRALNKDEHGRRITGNTDGPLFDQDSNPEYVETGTIYVLRSKSDHPFIAEHRELVHKIGVTGGNIEQRISGAEKQPTYLLAGVEVVATYKLHNLNRVKVEALLHKVFSGARLNLKLADRFGNPVEPREWFLAPLAAIDEAVDRLVDGSITEFVYDPGQAKLVMH